jgi:uncharacterized cupredoxin-like copper-binding protein
MKTYAFALVLAALAGPALASGTHSGGHAEKMAIGEPGDKARVTQTIRVMMKETDDGKMLFTPDVIKVRRDQTVKISIKNVGTVDHEFVLDQEDKIMEHKAVMEKTRKWNMPTPIRFGSHPVNPAISCGSSPPTASSSSRASSPVILKPACMATSLSQESNL